MILPTPPGGTSFESSTATLPTTILLQACACPGPVTVQCRQCDRQVRVKAYRRDTAHFCSHLCASQYRDEGKRTADKKLRQSAAYGKWRTAVFERDNYTCTSCGDHNYEGRGSTIIIQADHIKPFALHPELRLDVDNGRTLCVPCHRATGTFGRGSIYRSHERCMAAA